MFRRRRKKKQNWTVMFFIGLIMVIIAAGASFSKISFVLNSEAAQGTVVRIEQEIEYEEDGSIDETTNYPVVEFTTKSGEKVSFESIGTNFQSFKEGDQVEVLYDPEKPSDAEINTLLRMWGLPLILFPLGIVFVVFSQIMLFLKRRNPVS